MFVAKFTPESMVRHKLFQIIAEEIRGAGVIPFCRFMELALYCPENGYYEAEKDKLGKKGDYFTSVSVGSLFGQLLGVQIAEWFRKERHDAPARIAEAGAHDGRLAKDIMDWIREFEPALYDRTEYWVVEPSQRRRTWQHANLEQHRGTRWVGSVNELEHLNARTVFICNELLDAMPVQRLGWDATRREWFEWGVALRDDQFHWTRMEHPVPGSHPLLNHLPDDLLTVLPDGFTTEFSLSAVQLWQQACKALRNGVALAIDYGLTLEQFFEPHRRDGTLRAYSRHRLVEDVLGNPGERDITAHVNFSLIQEAGEQAGLATCMFTTQDRFFTDIASRIWKGERTFAAWGDQQTRQFKTLTHPGGLGGNFKVLVQQSRS